jgi:HlyD family secretion protein
MNKKHYSLAAAILIIIAFAASCTSGKEKESVFTTVEVKRGAIANSITATGTIEPIIQVEVGTQVSGIISKIWVDFNSVVKKGDILAELDKTTLEADLKSSEATLSSAKTEYDYQLKNYNRIKGLYGKGLISQTDYETAEYTMQKAKSAYDKSQSDILRVKQNLRYATIYSPIDGVVLNRAVDEGQTVAASFNTPTLFTIAKDLRNMQVIADIDEADIGEVKDGQNVEFEVDAFPGDVFRGNITQVRLEPKTTSNVVTYEVVISAPNPDLKLKPGLTANITITTEERNNILTVPSKALKFTPENVKQENSGGKGLWIKEKNGKLSRIAVKTGITDGINTEITDGIKEGTEIITGNGTTPDTAATVNQTKGESSSPFMPQRPGANRKK